MEASMEIIIMDVETHTNKPIHIWNPSWNLLWGPRSPTWNFLWGLQYLKIEIINHHTHEQIYEIHHEFCFGATIGNKDNNKYVQSITLDLKKHSTQIVMLKNILERFNSESEIDKTQLPDLFTKIDHTITEDLRLKDFAVRFSYFDGDVNGSAKKRKRKLLLGGTRIAVGAPKRKSLVVAHCACVRFLRSYEQSEDRQRQQKEKGEWRRCFGLSPLTKI